MKLNCKSNKTDKKNYIISIQTIYLVYMEGIKFFKAFSKFIIFFLYFFLNSIAFVSFLPPIYQKSFFFFSLSFWFICVVFSFSIIQHCLSFFRKWWKRICRVYDLRHCRGIRELIMLLKPSSFKLIQFILSHMLFSVFYVW